MFFHGSFFTTFSWIHNIFPSLYSNEHSQFTLIGVFVYSSDFAFRTSVFPRRLTQLYIYFISSYNRLLICVQDKYSVVGIVSKLSLKVSWEGRRSIRRRGWRVSVVFCVVEASTLFHLLPASGTPTMALFAPSSIVDLSDDVLLLIFSSLKSWDLLNLSR